MSLLGSYVAIHLNFEQIIETLSKVLSIVGELPERKNDEKIVK